MTYAEEKEINPAINEELERFFGRFIAWQIAEFGQDEDEVIENLFEPTEDHYEVGYAYTTFDINLGDGEEEVEIQVSADLFNYNVFAYFPSKPEFEKVVLWQFNSLEELVNEMDENEDMADCGDTAWDAYFYEGAQALRNAYEVEEH